MNLFERHCIHRRPRELMCDVGVNVRDLVGGDDFGWALRIPCIADYHENEGAATCEKFQLLTEEEAAAARQKMTDLMNAAAIAFEQVKDKPDGPGVIECPLCKGRLGYSIARNGRKNLSVVMKCETEDCLVAHQ